MPRAETTVTTATDTIDAPKKRAPRKRAVIASTEGDGTKTKTRSTRKRAAASDTSAKLATAVEPAETVRRAPTTLQAARKDSKKRFYLLVVVMMIFLLISITGVIIGLSDKGQIDVVAIVNERNEKVSRGEVRDEATGDTVTRLVPVSGASELPNGGLVPSGPATDSALPATTTSSTTTATSSDVMSSSTTPDLDKESEATTTPDTTNEESGQAADTATTP